MLMFVLWIRSQLLAFTSLPDMFHKECREHCGGPRLMEQAENSVESKTLIQPAIS